MNKQIAITNQGPQALTRLNNAMTQVWQVANEHASMQQTMANLAEYAKARRALTYGCFPSKIAYENNNSQK